jgi:hypothetical protein
VQPVPPTPPVQYSYPEQSMEALVRRGLSQLQQPPGAQQS